MIIDVVHVKDFGKQNKVVDDDTLYVYCGRPGRLGNPYPMKTEKDRLKVVNEFRNDPSSRILVNEFRQWLQQHTWASNLKLGCYCHPKPCHCDVIKEWLEN